MNILNEAILMIKYYVYFHDKIRKFSLNIPKYFFLELSEEFPTDSKRVWISHDKLAIDVRVIEVFFCIWTPGPSCLKTNDVVG